MSIPKLNYNRLVFRWICTGRSVLFANTVLMKQDKTGNRYKYIFVVFDLVPFSPCFRLTKRGKKYICEIMKSGQSKQQLKTDFQ